MREPARVRWRFMDQVGPALSWHEWCCLKHVMRLAPAIALCLLLSAPLRAQQVPDAQQVAAPETAPKSQETSRFSKVSKIMNGPLHPIVKGVVAGGGLGVGLSYEFPTSGRWETVAQTVVTFRRYWSAELETAYRTTHGRVGAYGRLREMSQLSYFGPGLHSDVGDRTNFLLRDPVVGAVASARLADWISAGLRAEETLGHGWVSACAESPSIRKCLYQRAGC